MNEIKYSIIIPVYNEEESLVPLVQELMKAMKNIPEAFEVVFVNDGSEDKSPQIIKDLRKEYGEIRLVDLKPRQRQTLALQKGFDAARGSILITLDADLQNDPTDIPLLIEKVEQGFDVACGWRKSRQDKFLKMVLSKTGNILQRLITRCSIHDVSCTLRAYRRECFEGFSLSWEGQHRYIPLILSLRGFKVTEIVSHHRQRRFGQSKYKHSRIFKVAVDFFKVLTTSR